MNIAFVYMNTVRNIGRGAGYVLASIPREHTVSFFDTIYDNPVSAIKTGWYDLAMFSTMTMTFPLMMKMIREIKGKRKDIAILVGGIHPTIAYTDIMINNPEIDYLCIGEGETFVRKFLNDFDSPRLYDLENLVYKLSDDKIQLNFGGVPEDLAMLPDFPYGSFRKVVVEDGWVYVHATRGCPYDCTYCCNGIYKGLYGREYLRHRPVGKIIEEMKSIQRIYDPKMFYFGDEEIFAWEDYSKELFRAIKKHMAVPYGCMFRAQSVTEETIEMLMDTGCRYVAMGIECGDEWFRKTHLNRFESNAWIKRIFGLCGRAGFRTCSFNMIGWPMENDDELCRATIELNEEIKPDIMQTTWFYPFPGTKLHDLCKDKRLIDSSLSTLSYHHGSILFMHENKPKSASEYLERFDRK